jgi:hypothetical protein
MVSSNPICFDFKISKNFAFESSFFHKIRNFKDGISVLKLDFNLDFFKGDHNPKYSIELIALNFMVFEFRIYNINHSSPIVDCTSTPSFKKQV